jgi:hypothetical protein
MNELLALGIIGIYMTIAYAFVYPRAQGITSLRWLDLMFSILAIGTVGLVFGLNNPMNTLMGINWFLFALIAYVVIETPAWFVYMKAHPEQGTLAQLYGIQPSSKKRKEKAAQNYDAVMNDTKWDGLRTSRAQKILVTLAVFSMVSAPVLFWFEDTILPGFGLVSVIAIFLLWWMLRASVRLVADAPDEYLDEYQVQQRDRTYVHSFRILAGVVSVMAVSLILVAFSTDYTTVGTVDYYTFTVTFGQINSLIWLILGPVILVPNLVLAWTQSQSLKV